MHFLQPAHIGWLGMGGWWTMLMLNVHAFWSIGTSIALTEGIFPESAERRWLGRVGTAVFGVMFVLGLLANWAIGYKQNGFTASALQFCVAGASLVLLVGLAFVVAAGTSGVARRAGASAGGFVPASRLLTGGICAACAARGGVGARWRRWRGRRPGLPRGGGCCLKT